MEPLRKILLIDDDRLQFRLAQQFFKRFRAEVFHLDWSATYEEGMERLFEGGYTACLLDYKLGRRDGIEFIKEARQRGSVVPIIFLTAETGADVDLAALEAGALDYLVKGEITPAALERSLRYALKLSETLSALENLATHDALTGLLNRRVMDRVLKEEWERSKRFLHSFAFVILDVDHFKRVNDTYGHPAGDLVLKETAKTLAAEMRSVDRLCRFGGEEFAALLVHVDPAATLDAARRFCSAAAGSVISLPSGASISITLSAGVAIAPNGYSTVEALIADADRALYAAKAAGRNRVVGANLE